MALSTQGNLVLVATTLGIFAGGAVGAKLGGAGHRIGGILIGVAAGALVTNLALVLTNSGAAQLPQAPSNPPPATGP